MEVWEKSMRRLCWRYTRNRSSRALENELNKQGLGGSGQNALEKMKEIEKQILNKGFKNETLQKNLNVKQELLKLNSAVQQQGEEKKRQSSNKREFNNESKPLPDALLDYLNSIEILTDNHYLCAQITTARFKNILIKNDQF
jgi:hypothetical protein